MDYVDSFIKSIKPIAPLSDKEIGLISSNLEYREYQKHDFLTEAGNVENYVYYLIEGIARNYCLNDGNDISLDFFLPGNFTNSYTSFLTRQASTVNVQALTDLKTLRIHFNSLQFLYESSLAVNKLGRAITESLYIKRTKRELSFITKTARERYEDLLHEHPEFIQNIPQKYLSTFIGVTPEALSRLRKSSRTRH